MSGRFKQSAHASRDPPAGPPRTRTRTRTRSRPPEFRSAATNEAPRRSSAGFVEPVWVARDIIKHRRGKQGQQEERSRTSGGQGRGEQRGKQVDVAGATAGAGAGGGGGATRGWVVGALASGARPSAPPERRQPELLGHHLPQLLLVLVGVLDDVGEGQLAQL